MIPVKDVIPTRTTPLITISLIGVYTLVFLFGVITGTEQRQIFRFGLTPADFDAGRMLTSMFVHAGWLHFALNMLYLWIFAENVEDRIGRAKFVAFYLVCGIAAAVAQTFIEAASQVAMVGPGGAIAGVMGAYFVLYPRSRVLMFFPLPLTLTEVPAVFFLVFWFLLQSMSVVGALPRLIGVDASGGITLVAQGVAFVVGALLCVIFRRPIAW